MEVGRHESGVRRKGTDRYPHPTGQWTWQRPKVAAGGYQTQAVEFRLNKVNGSIKGPNMKSEIPGGRG